MNNPHIVPPAPHPRNTRPLHKRKRVWIGGFVLMAIGSAIGQSDAHDDAVKAAAEARPTVTATATVTATPKPAVTVTKTRPAPAPAVTVAKTETADTSNSSLGTGSSNSGTCSIVSNAGNCYSAGEFCRNGDHGATTNRRRRYVHHLFPRRESLALDLLLTWLVEGIRKQPRHR